MFIIIILLAVVGLGALVAGFLLPNGLAKLIGAGVLALAIVLGFFGSTFTQERGEASVLKDITGNIVGQETSTGLHFKAPWVDAVTFDILNQSVVFAGTNGSDNSGGDTTGPQITVQDAEGVTSNLDISLRYSIKPDAVENVFSKYQNQDTFQKTFIEQDIRSVVRSVPNSYTTLELVTKRTDIENEILESLTKRWADDGVVVDSISLQEIRLPDEVKKSYEAAQQAEIAVSAEQSKLDAAKVSAQQKVVQAQAEADANAILNASLTPAILQQRYLDTLAKLAEAGNLVVVPEGFGGIVNIGK